MNARFYTILAVAFGTATLALAAAEPPDAPAAGGGVFDQQAVAQAADAPAEAGVQPQGRGPVHEAFAAPAADLPKPGPVVPKQPPPAIEELPPPEKPEGDDVQWISGYWGFDDERGGFVWVSGIWRAIPPGRQWVPGHWAQVEGGWQWTAGFWAAADGGEVAVVPAPPDPQPETQPAAPTADSTFVPGNYVYQQSHYVWQPGYYVTNRPGFVWTPAHYVYTPCGYIFVDGYWDYDVQGRGLLFAPVVIDAATLAQADYVYAPEYVVHDVALLDSLFVRPDCGCYYYGDYFDPGYARLGYVNWFDYRYGRHGFDPLFGYYRWYHRHERSWEPGLRALYRARTQTGVGRPPRTLARQQALARNLLANGNRDALRHGVLLGRVSRLDRNVVKLQTLNRTGQLRQRQLAERRSNVGRRRELAEGRLIAQGRSALGKGGTAQRLPLTLARSVGSGRPGPGRTLPPPLPVGQKHVERLTGNTGIKRTGPAGLTTNLRNGRTNNGTGNTTGLPGGVKLNTKPTNRTGPTGGQRLGNATTNLKTDRAGRQFTPPQPPPGNNGTGRLTGGTLRTQPIRNLTNPVGANGGFRPAGGTVTPPTLRTQRVERKPASQPPARTFSPAGGSLNGGRFNSGFRQQSFTPSGGQRTFNAPPSRTFQNFSAPSGRTFGGSSGGGRQFGSGGGGGRTFGGGGGGRRR